jgi:hypothetical protein
MISRCTALEPMTASEGGETATLRVDTIRSSVCGLESPCPRVKELETRDPELGTDTLCRIESVIDHQVAIARELFHQPFDHMAAQHVVES